MKIEHNPRPLLQPNDNILRDLAHASREVLYMNVVLPKHPNLIELVELVVSPVNIYVIFEYCRGGSLQLYCPQAQNDEAKRLFQTACETIKLCHDHGVVHNNISAEDFMFSTHTRAELKLRGFGSALYRPEWASKQQTGFNPGDWLGFDARPWPDELKKNDIRGLGRILQFMICGTALPLNLPDVSLQDLTQVQYRPRTESFEPAALDLLRTMGPHPFGPQQNQDLPTIEQVLAHPWLTGQPIAPPVVPVAYDVAEYQAELVQRLTKVWEDWRTLPQLLIEQLQVPVTVLQDDAEFGQQYHIRGPLNIPIKIAIRQTRALEVENGGQTMVAKVLKIRPPNLPPTHVERNFYEYNNGASIYLELLIALRILPQHPHVATLNAVLVAQKFVVLVQEPLWRGLRFQEFVGQEASCRVLFRQLVQTVRFLHRFGVVLRQLSPNNICFNDGALESIKISSFVGADFVPALARVRFESFKWQRYLPMDVFQQKDPVSSVQADISALGSILLGMAVGEFDRAAAVRAGLDVRASEWSALGKELVRKIAPPPEGPNPANRNFSIAQILDHPWFAVRHVVADNSPASSHS